MDLHRLLPSPPLIGEPVKGRVPRHHRRIPTCDLAAGLPRGGSATPCRPGPPPPLALRRSRNPLRAVSASLACSGITGGSKDPRLQGPHCSASRGTLKTPQDSLPVKTAREGVKGGNPLWKRFTPILKATQIRQGEGHCFIVDGSFSFFLSFSSRRLGTHPTPPFLRGAKAESFGLLSKLELWGRFSA